MLGRRARAATAAAAVVLSACGAPGKSLSELTSASTSVGSGPTTPPSTTRPPATTRPEPTTSPTTAGSSSTAELAASTWVPATTNLAGMPSECGNILLVSGRPDRDTVIASVALHGLWATTGASESWTGLGSGGGATITNRGTSIVYDPMHPDTFWETGIYNGGGVYRTDDDGTTFRQLGDIAHVDAVSVDFSDPGRRTLVAGLHEQTGVMRSHDGGQTWTKISGTLPPGVGFTSSPFVVDSHTFLVGTNKGANAGVFRTTDDGVTWTQVFTGAVTGQPLLTSAGKLFWIVDSSGGIIGSSDGGRTWLSAARAGTVETLAPNLVELPGGAIAAVGKQAIIASQDEGAKWTQIGPTMPYLPAGMTFSPARQAFYIWYYTCDSNGSNAVPADGIMRLDLRSG